MKNKLILPDLQRYSTSVFQSQLWANRINIKLSSFVTKELGTGKHGTTICNVCDFTTTDALPDKQRDGWGKGNLPLSVHDAFLKKTESNKTHPHHQTERPTLSICGLYGALIKLVEASSSSRSSRIPVTAPRELLYITYISYRKSNCGLDFALVDLRTNAPKWKAVTYTDNSDIAVGKNGLLRLWQVGEGEQKKLIGEYEKENGKYLTVVGYYLTLTERRSKFGLNTKFKPAIGYSKGWYINSY